MRYIFYILFIVNLIFGNDELNSYLNNKNLKYQIIKDEKNQRIIIDLLYENSSSIVIFSKNKKEKYQKTFNEKLFFCQNHRYSNTMIKREKQKLFVVCSMPNVDNGLYREFYKFENLSNLNSKLLSIEKQYININNDTIKAKYTFKPQIDIPTLKNYTDKNFSEKYLDNNYKNFKKIK